MTWAIDNESLFSRIDLIDAVLLIAVTLMSFLVCTFLDTSSFMDLSQNKSAV